MYILLPDKSMESTTLKHDNTIIQSHYHNAKEYHHLSLEHQPSQKAAPPFCGANFLNLIFSAPGAPIVFLYLVYHY